MSHLLVATPAHTQPDSLSAEKICLDPGRGGFDPTAVYNDRTIYLEEADIWYLASSTAVLAQSGLSDRAFIDTPPHDKAEQQGLGPTDART